VLASGHALDGGEVGGVKDFLRHCTIPLD